MGKGLNRHFCKEDTQMADKMGPWGPLAPPPPCSAPLHPNLMHGACLVPLMSMSTNPGPSTLFLRHFGSFITAFSNARVCFRVHVDHLSNSSNSRTLIFSPAVVLPLPLSLSRLWSPLDQTHPTSASAPCPGAWLQLPPVTPGPVACPGHTRDRRSGLLQTPHFSTALDSP